MAAKRRNNHEEEPEHENNTERWLLPYADMITLLVACFIMLYSMSVMDLNKFNRVAISIRSGFGGQFGGQGNNPHTKKGVGEIKSAQLIASASSSPGPFGTDDVGSDDFEVVQTIGNYIQNQFALLKLDQSFLPILDVADNQGNRYRVIISDSIAFAPDSTVLSDACKTNLMQAGSAIRDTNLRLLVEGYARHPSATNSAFSDSWQLAAERARTVSAYLSDVVRINPRRLSLISYGEWRDPGKTKKLSYSKSGVWEESSKPGASGAADRVVVSVIID